MHLYYPQSSIQRRVFVPHNLKNSDFWLLFFHFFSRAFFYPEASGVIKGFNIFAEAIPEGSLGCGINIVTTNTNTYKSDFYLEVRALNEEGEKIDMTSFFIQNIKPMEKIETLSHFKKLKFCAEINNLELFVK